MGHITEVIYHAMGLSLRHLFRMILGRGFSVPNDRIRRVTGKRGRTGYPKGSMVTPVELGPRNIRGCFNIKGNVFPYHWFGRDSLPADSPTIRLNRLGPAMESGEL